ncbi:Oidioi.mRNA.OKI2018_I69.XSR.g14775.t1.cds [Oikopleura dioica]|uniref:Oidioi.mRNA.OKI2018_I69.XSR.g14775.t1.cds n=1 Tax=Oikopleura dioica TaxID=34765 RepID=A0ABN7SAR9_OIKDI|nr:Oidioi.mRNA.OKI2018_I69.XSR.g14775.t1.cds [Oikopleura dioica]
MNMLRKSVLNEQVIAEERKLVNRKEMDWYWPKFAASLADAFIEYLEDNESEHGQTLKINQIAPVVTESTGYYQVEEDIPEAPRKTIPGDWHYIPMDSTLESLIGAILITINDDAFWDLLQSENNAKLKWIHERTDLNRLVVSAALQSFSALFQVEAETYLWDSRDLRVAIQSGSPCIGLKILNDFAELTFFSKRDSEWSVCSISKHILESIFLNREYFDDVYFEALTTANFSAHNLPLLRAVELFPSAACVQQRVQSSQPPPPPPESGTIHPPGNEEDGHHHPEAMVATESKSSAKSNRELGFRFSDQDAMDVDYVLEKPVEDQERSPVEHGRSGNDNNLSLLCLAAEQFKDESQLK